MFKKKVNVKKLYENWKKKKNIYIDVKTDKDEYVKLIIYFYIYCKKKNNNYVAMRWCNR